MVRTSTRVKRALLAPLFLVIGLASPMGSSHQEKTAVFILGAPRSGTSAVAGSLKCMGLQLGRNLSKPQSWNPKGDFEDQATICLNKIILQRLNISPYDKEAKRIDLKESGMRQYVDLIRQHLVFYFGDYQVFGIKHPKMCLLLPFYIQAAQELGYKVKLIIVKRRPSDIIRSLNKTTKQAGNLLNYERGAAYVNSFMLAIDAYTSDVRDKVVISFDEVMTETRATFTALQGFIPGLMAFSQVEKEVCTFLDRPLEKEVKEGIARDSFDNWDMMKEWIYAAK